MNQHPHIFSLFELYQSETQPFRKVHRMIDLFESIIKMHTVVIMAEYFKQNKISDSAKGLLAQGLRTPSLGTWQLFSRVLFEELQKEGFSWSFSEFDSEFSELDKALNADKTNVISFRNTYAHGATPSDAQCETDIKKFEPFLQKLLNRKWLNITRIEHQENKVWIISDEQRICLHPILVYKKDGNASPYPFFNDLKNDKVGLLNYPLSKHYREKEFFKEFHEYLPLHEWKKAGNNEFYQRIEELTETFKGRTAERQKLLQFVLNNEKGYFSIQGNPGIGKSALIAQFFKDLKANTESSEVQVVEYFIRRGTAQAQVEYIFEHLIKKTDELFPPGKEIRAEGKTIWDFQQQLFSKWRMWGEQSNGKKLLFLIDGLDEGVENNVVTYLPRENFENVLIVYGSRPGGHKTIDELWTQLPAEYHTKLELSGLSVEDIRALIYEVANKYEIGRESKWIDAVQQRSQGNPLYLKLLCDAIAHGSIALNDIMALPEKIDEYYKAILVRYANDMEDGDALLKGLYAFAAAKDYLTMAHLGLINQLGEASIQRIGSTLKEVLYENPLTEDVLDYQLFHESFREYLVKQKAKQVTDASERIIDFCAGWKQLEGSWEQRYALEHYAIHLSESKKAERHQQLIELLYDNEYITTQKKVLRGFDASNELYRLSLLKSSELDRFEDMLESALCLVDLKYEEANDAPKIVEMVANGELNLALKRIESFGGNDKEGMKRKFILYMLCLMELTLLDSKDKPFRKAAIERILNHLDEQVPPDTSLINWNAFFPSYLIFLMACEWAELGLDYLIVYKRTNSWEIGWIKDNENYSDLNFEVLLSSARVISHKHYRNEKMCAISAELVKRGKVEESLLCARGISNKGTKSVALHTIYIELAKQGNIEAYSTVLEEALVCLNEINDEDKSSVLRAISNELAKQGNIEESLVCARGISNEYYKSIALGAISTELAKQGNEGDARAVILEALVCARVINDEYSKSRALEAISTELAKQGNIEEALVCARGISHKSYKSSALGAISTELAKKGNIEEANVCARVINDEYSKSRVLEAISTELAKQGNIEEALVCARGINDKYSKSSALEAISTELAKKGNIGEALVCVRGINDEYSKRRAQEAISIELAKQGNLVEAAIMMHESLVCARGIGVESDKSSELVDISNELANQGHIEEALICARRISDESDKSKVLGAISTELTKNGEVEESATVINEALVCARGISHEFSKSIALGTISTKLLKQGNVEEAAMVMEEALVCARGISKDYLQTEHLKSWALRELSTELAKQGNEGDARAVILEALVCAREISFMIFKSMQLGAISTELAKQGNVEDSAMVVEESLVCVSGISDEFIRSSALKDISIELVKQGNVEKSLVCARGISDHMYKSTAMQAISNELANHGNINESATLLEEAIVCTSGINNEELKSSALDAISTQLVKQNKIQEAEKIGLEISRIAERQKCWGGMAKAIKEKEGWQSALLKFNQLQNEEARLFYLKGYADSIVSSDANKNCLQASLPLLAEDSDSIEKLLQAYSQHEVFYSKPPKELIARLNCTLNIQWALDIVAQFPKDQNIQRLSTNLDEWLHEISDEDDREEIELLAKKVAKGKMTEEEFRERVLAFE